MEGRPLIAVEVGHTDSGDTTILHVPSIGLVVAGDVAYNDVHVYLAESDHDKRMEWLLCRMNMQMNAWSPTRVFNSHAAPDVPFVEELIEILEMIALTHEQIFCTSYSGYRIDLGDNFLEAIKAELLNANALVLFIPRSVAPRTR